jgi:flagellar biosynthesis/type III secretory pathway protein FliH
MNAPQRPVDPADAPRRRVVGRAQRPPLAAATDPPVVDPALQALEHQVTELQHQLSRMSTRATEQARQLEEAAREIEVTRESSLAEGFTDGLRQAEADFTARSEALAEALASALRTYDSAVKGLEKLSSMIALAALDRVLGPAHGRDDAVARIVARQVDLLASLAPVEVRVSGEDFADSAALHDALVRVGADPARVRADPVLPSGQVTIRLRLGEVDAGIDQQLTALRRLLLENTDAR